ncbi:hypothetical protein APS_0686 [Acetobacter pasteurianus subsp. pasteurianus LMG 1262 = NBRC 106471]|nr:hypothetical protein APS_0686 [Acetobacter pasteurianus subsp. pasteurianus LMG 1262 = NBRC 106471]
MFLLGFLVESVNFLHKVFTPPSFFMPFLDRSGLMLPSFFHADSASNF